MTKEETLLLAATILSGNSIATNLTSGKELAKRLFDLAECINDEDKKRVSTHSRGYLESKDK